MSSALSQLPKVSYIKLIDVYLTVCLGFVFAGFLEYALVNKLATRERKTQKRKDEQAAMAKEVRQVPFYYDIVQGSSTCNIYL